MLKSLCSGWRWPSVPPSLLSESEVLASFEDVCHLIDGAATHVDSGRAVVGPNDELLDCKCLWMDSGAVLSSRSDLKTSMRILALADRVAIQLQVRF